MGLRYTKQRKAIEEGILQTYGLEQFNVDKYLLENMAIQLSDTRKELAALKSRSVFSIIRERLFK
jgi:hypothetical protein